MNLPQPLLPGKFIRRYKRFFADVATESGEVVTAHCPNSGSMLGLLQSGNPVLLSESLNPKRKLKYTWELVKVNETWVCVNTLTPNRLISEALKNKQIKEFAGYGEIKAEAKWNEGTRFDFLLQKDNRKCFVEVKNVTLEENETALFPDAVTTRGAKHLRELINVVTEGHRGVMLFLVSRGDCTEFEPAKNIDRVYAEMLQKAYEAGVEILVYRAKINPPEILIDTPLLFEILQPT